MVRKLSILTLIALIILTSPVIAADKVRIQLFGGSANLPNVNIISKDGREASIDVAANELVLLNFWATWCVPCIVELPSLAAMAVEMKAHNVRLVLVSVDEGGLSKSAQFLEEKGLGHIEQYVDPNKNLYSALNVNGLPTTYIIDDNNIVKGKIEGAVNWQEKALQEQILNLK